MLSSVPKPLNITFIFRHYVFSMYHRSLVTTSGLFYIIEPQQGFTVALEENEGKNIRVNSGNNLLSGLAGSTLHIICSMFATQVDAIKI